MLADEFGDVVDSISDDDPAVVGRGMERYLIEGILGETRPGGRRLDGRYNGSGFVGGDLGRGVWCRKMLVKNGSNQLDRIGCQRQNLLTDQRRC